MYFWSSCPGQCDTLWRLDSKEIQAIRSFVGDAESETGSYPGLPVVLGDDVYFFLHIAGGESGLWRSDGTESGTELLLEKPFTFVGSSETDGVYPESLTVLGEALVFFERIDPALRLWHFDPATEEAIILATLHIAENAQSSTTLVSEGVSTNVVFEETLYFVVQAYGAASQLWVSDGTINGTVQKADLPIGAPYNLHVTSQNVFGLTNLGIVGTYLWAIPQKNPNPVVLRNLGSHFTLYPRFFTVGEHVYFSARLGDPRGREILWLMDPDAIHPTNVFMPLIQNQ